MIVRQVTVVVYCSVFVEAAAAAAAQVLYMLCLISGQLTKLMLHVQYMCIRVCVYIRVGS